MSPHTEYALKVQERTQRYVPRAKDFRLNNIHLAILWYAPLSTFRTLEDVTPAIKLHEYLETLPPLVKHFLAGWSDPTYIKYSAAISDCKKRDNNTCVLTGASDPEVCHIVPFSWNSTRFNTKKTQCVFQASVALMGPKWTNDNSPLLANSRALGGSDHVWNTICLNPLLHKWWAQALFGLKCLGIIFKDENTSVVKVQFRWMPPRSKKNPTVPCNLTENEGKKMVEEIRSFTDGGSLPATPKHGEIGLLSGHTFHVEMPPEDAGRFRDMLDLQWACIVIAALSGARPDLLPDHPGRGGTLAWIGQLPLEGYVNQPPATMDTNIYP
ncbi:hypothetical protein CEP54_005987 [Fusarium duplospermum]|uniref:HNH nuclease domain-containing protein n=1 Tax=Fusarium duplospermum TaxID=1325734 RepID=A0A428Q9F1_9HYPO|nr:hypothetical protein CEP54_005987 [Fusarium duplospermum]